MDFSGAGIGGKRVYHSVSPRPYDSGLRQCAEGSTEWKGKRDKSWEAFPGLPDLNQCPDARLCSDAFLFYFNCHICFGYEEKAGDENISASVSTQPELFQIQL